MPHATEPSNPSNPNGSIAMTSNMPEYIVAAVNNANNANNASNAAQVFYTADQNAMAPQQFLPYRQYYTCCGEDRVNLHDLFQHIDTVHPNLFVDSTYGIMSFDTSTIYSPQSISPSTIPVSFLEAPSFPNISIQKDHQLTEEERNNQMNQLVASMSKWFGDIGQSDDLSQSRDDESCNTLPGALRDPKTATPFLGPTALSDNDLLAMKAKANNKNDDDFYLTSPYSPSSPLDLRDAPTPLDLRDALDAPSPLDLIPALEMENQEMTSLSPSSINNASVPISSTASSPDNGATGSSITSLNYSTSSPNIRSNVSYSTTPNDGSNVSYSTSPSTTPSNISNSVGQCQSDNTSVAVSYSITNLSSTDQSQSSVNLDSGVTASPIASLTTNFNLIDQNQPSAIFNTAATTASSATRVNSTGQSQSSVTSNAVINAARFDHQSPMNFNKATNAPSAARFGHVPLNARLRQYQSPVAFNTGADQRQYSIVDNTAVSATSSRGIQTSQYRPSSSVVATAFTSPRVTMEQIHRAPINRNTATSSTTSVNTVDQRQSPISRNTTTTANSSTANINAMYQRQSSITGTTASSRLNLMGQRQSNNHLTARILSQRQTAFTAGRINQRLYNTIGLNNGTTTAIINNSTATTINDGTTAISATINSGTTTTTATINQCPPSMSDLQNNMNQQQSSYGSLTIPTFLSDNSSSQQTTYSSSPTNNSYTNYYQANSNSSPAAATTDQVTLGNNSLTSVDNTVDGYTGRPGLRSGHSSSFVVARYPPIQPKSDISVSMADVYTDPSLGYSGGPSQGNKRASASSEDPRPNKKRAKAPVPLSADSREDTDMYPYKCPVPGCPKAYKNANGLKYHNEHGHVPQ
ncbi:9288_t:CDS:2 [Diversispora eburnea]|uniref:9288_t:CDS:1 n=1 Tax=Diversispora eburnea TaxID=1213867 RepID=A0A9N9G2Z5_9GLOM|nr:9288_t:CDS:2 [Diversispora eburnea]